MIPTIPGVPSWGAVLIAVTFTAIGFAFDAGSGAKELTLVFAAAYAVGCIAAVLAVRQSGIFTAVIQPPLILFVAVPGAYFLFHGGTMDGLKDLLINCGYPLIERFPLMFFTSAIVLLIGMARWYTGHVEPPCCAAPKPPSRRGPVLGGDGQDLRRCWHATARTRTPTRRRAPRRSKQHSIDRGDQSGQAGRGHRADPRVDGPPSAPSRHARGTLARRRPRSSSPSPNVPAGRVRPPSDRPDGSAARTASPAAHVVERPAEPRKQTAAERAPVPATSGPIGTAGSTASSRSNRTPPTASNGTGPTAQPPPDLAGALPRGRRRRAASAVSGPATRRQAPGRCLGVRRLDGSSWRAGANLAGQREDQRLVGGRHRLHRAETDLGQPIQARREPASREPTRRR